MIGFFIGIGSAMVGRRLLEVVRYRLEMDECRRRLAAMGKATSDAMKVMYE